MTTRTLPPCLAEFWPGLSIEDRGAYYYPTMGGTTLAVIEKDEPEIAAALHIVIDYLARRVHGLPGEPAPENVDPRLKEGLRLLTAGAERLMEWKRGGGQ